MNLIGFLPKLKLSQCSGQYIQFFQGESFSWKKYHLKSKLLLPEDDDNDFVDVLVAIEEEMAAVRELYVGGYISKGVYISETDRLYEKAKIFGL